jgi:hypothetical protein
VLRVRQSAEAEVGLVRAAAVIVSLLCEVDFETILEVDGAWGAAGTLFMFQALIRQAKN